MKPLKPYKYKIQRTLAPEVNLGKHVIRPKSQEQLTGYVQQKKASDLEERAARALDSLGISYTFRVRVTPLISGLPRRLTKSLAVIQGETEIDFLADAAQTYPIQIDGEIAHFKTPWQAEIDFWKTKAIDNFGKLYGWHETVRIPFTKMVTQEQTTDTIRAELGI